MPVTINCPRCHTSLAAPEKLAGSYAFCPKCQGRMWVPPSAAGSTVSVGSAATATTANGPSVMPEAPPLPMPANASVDPMAPMKSAQRPHPATPPDLPGTHVAAPAPPPQSPPAIATPVAPPSATAAAPETAPPIRRVAQFITADVAQSQLTIAADGKLPELHLSAGDTAPRKRKSAIGGEGNSWGLVVLVCVSLTISLVIMLMPGPSSTSGPSRSSQVERDRLRRTYIGQEGPELREYQKELRRALQAHDRGDLKEEQRLYLVVLNRLREENLHKNGGSLTGMQKSAQDITVANDEHLEQILSNLLGER